MAQAGDIPLDEQGFTKTLAKLFRKALPDRHIRMAGALTLTMPSNRYDARHVKPVLDAARRLSGLV